MTTSHAIAALLTKQLRQRYRALDRALTAGVGPAESERQIGDRPSIAWHARHLGDAIESTRAALFGHPPEHGDEGAWPARWEELRDAVLAAGTALAHDLEQGDPEDLERSPQIPILPAFQEALSTRQSFLEGHIYHVAYHVGSIAVSRAAFDLD